MKTILLYVPERDLELLNDLVKMKKYPTRSEAIRMAIKDLLWEEHTAYENYRQLLKSEKRGHMQSDRMRKGKTGLIKIFCRNFEPANRER